MDFSCFERAVLCFAACVRLIVQLLFNLHVL